MNCEVGGEAGANLPQGTESHVDESRSCSDKALTRDSADALTHQRARLPLSGPERALPLIIDCHRLRTTEPMHDGAVRDHDLLVLHDLKDAPPINLRLLIESFGLTRAEARGYPTIGSREDAHAIAAGLVSAATSKQVSRAAPPPSYRI